MQQLVNLESNILLPGFPFLCNILWHMALLLMHMLRLLSVFFVCTGLLFFFIGIHVLVCYKAV